MPPRRMNLTKEQLEKLYWKEQKSSGEIGDILSLDPSTVRNWLHKYNIPRRNWTEVNKLVAQKYTYNRPLLKMTNTLAYILGILSGDGFITVLKKGSDCRIRLNTKDKRFAEHFASALKKIDLLVALYFVPSNKTWQLCANSIEFVQWYKALSLQDIRSLLIRRKGYITQFIKGFYESEGTTGHYGYQHALRMVNTNENLIKMIYELLPKISFHFHLYTKKPQGWGKKPIFELGLFRREEIHRFLRLINPCIKRKSLANLESWA